MTHLEIQDEQRRQIEELRRLTADWLAFYKVTKPQLSESIGVTPSCLYDFLTGRRGLSTDNFLKLGAIVRRPANPNRGARMAHIQNFGSTTPDSLDIDIDKARAEFEAQRSAKIHAANQRRQQIDL